MKLQFDATPDHDPCLKHAGAGIRGQALRRATLAQDGKLSHNFGGDGAAYQLDSRLRGNDKVIITHRINPSTCAQDMPVGFRI